MPKRGFLYAGIALYIASFMLSLPFPNNMNTYAQLSVLSIPLQTSDGVYVKGVFSLLFLLGSIACFLKSVNKLKAAAVIVPLIVYILLPSVAIPMYQAYVAEGMNAIQYEQRDAGCQLTALDEQTVQVYCELPMKNYSDAAVTVGVEFIGGEAVEALNVYAPYTISLSAQQETTIIIDEKHPNVDGGYPREVKLSSPSIRLIQGDQKRTM